MKRHVFLTADGSTSIRIDALKETYHSRHGALQESLYVYIEKGLSFWLAQHRGQKCSIFELGFGTGLNAFLTANFANQNGCTTDYLSIENAPLSPKEVKTLNYNDLANSKENSLNFEDLHSCSWDTVHNYSNFNLLKKNIEFARFESDRQFDVLYYDAFGAHAQPELWTDRQMQKCYDMLRPGGVWVSYCAKGSVRRSLKNAGFYVERLLGPPNKREMLRATKK